MHRYVRANALRISTIQQITYQLTNATAVAVNRPSAHAYRAHEYAQEIKRESSRILRV